MFRSTNHDFREFTQLFMLFWFFVILVSPVKSADTWNTLIFENSYVVQISGVKQLKGNFVTYSQLTGYLPNGMRANFDRLVGSNIYSIVHECGKPTVSYAFVSVHDLQGTILLQHDFEPFVVVEIEKDRALGASTSAACQADKGESRFIRIPPPARDTVTLICNSKEMEQEILVTFSEEQRTANGYPAVISPDAISFSKSSNTENFTMRINRHTGQYTLIASELKTVNIGRCVKSNGRKF